MLGDDSIPSLVPDLAAASAGDARAPSWAAASLVPSQFFDGADWRRVARGEVALRLAILEDAICCFEREGDVAGAGARRLARDAERWLFRDESCGPFSFLEVCDALGIEPGPLRRWLRARRERRRQGDMHGAGRVPVRRRHVVMRRGRTPRAA
jgi:hypothetical protein